MIYPRMFAAARYGYRFKEVGERVRNKRLVIASEGIRVPPPRAERQHTTGGRARRVVLRLSGRCAEEHGKQCNKRKA